MPPSALEPGANGGAGSHMGGFTERVFDHLVNGPHAVPQARRSPVWAEK